MIWRFVQSVAKFRSIIFWHLLLPRAYTFSMSFVSCVMKRTHTHIGTLKHTQNQSERLNKSVKCNVCFVWVIACWLAVAYKRICKTVVMPTVWHRAKCHAHVNLKILIYNLGKKKNISIVVGSPSKLNGIQWNKLIKGRYRVSRIKGQIQIRCM